MLYLSSLFVLFSVCFTISGNGSPIKNAPANKVILVIVDETGTISIGRDTVSSDELANYIRERLFKSYMGTGKMYDKILFSRTSENVPKIVADVVLEEIKLGQERALNELCLQKYNDRFENISSRQKSKLKKQFPILFQTKYS